MISTKSKKWAPNFGDWWYIKRQMHHHVTESSSHSNQELQYSINFEFFANHYQIYKIIMKLLKHLLSSYKNETEYKLIFNYFSTNKFERQAI